MHCLMNAMRQSHADGWFIVFDTLSLADERLEDFFDFFFFQAEDGIRDLYVTGVQTCALPISSCEAMACFAVQFQLLRGTPVVDAIERGCFEEHIACAVMDFRFGSSHNTCDSDWEIGRASCRERVWMSVGAISVDEKSEGLRDA